MPSVAGLSSRHQVDSEAKKSFLGFETVRMGKD
jgi:hypothetical protein